MGTLHPALWRRHPVTSQNLWERQRLSRVWSGMSRETIPSHVHTVFQSVFFSVCSLSRSWALSHLMRWRVSGDEIGTSNTTKSPGYIYTVAAAIRFITKTYLIPHTHTVIAPHMNRLIFCRKAFLFFQSMDDAREALKYDRSSCWQNYVMPVLFLLPFSHMHTHTHSHSSTVWVKIRENEHDSCSFSCPSWKRIKEYRSGSCGCMRSLKCVFFCLLVCFFVILSKQEF